MGYLHDVRGKPHPFIRGVPDLLLEHLIQFSPVVGPTGEPDDLLFFRCKIDSIFAEEINSAIYHFLQMITQGLLFLSALPRFSQRVFNYDPFFAVQIALCCV